MALLTLTLWIAEDRFQAQQGVANDGQYGLAELRHRRWYPDGDIGDKCSHRLCGRCVVRGQSWASGSHNLYRKSYRAAGQYDPRCKGSPCWDACHAEARIRTNGRLFGRAARVVSEARRRSGGQCRGIGPHWSERMKTGGQAPSSTPPETGCSFRALNMTIARTLIPAGQAEAAT